MEIGLALRQARERRGISLAQLSHITKISVGVLKAIEAADAQALPAAVYTRGFVKAYAEEVGLDPAETVRLYLAQFEAPQDAEARDEPEPVVREENGSRSRIPAQVLTRRGRIAAASAMLLLVIVAISSRAGRDGALPATLPPAQPAAVGAAIDPPATPQPAPIGTAGAVPARALHVEIAPTAPCWVQATVGGERQFGMLLNAGDRRVVDSSTDVTLRVGDPAACAFAINGKPARVAAPAGVAVTVRLTPENYGQFLVR